MRKTALLSRHLLPKILYVSGFWVCFSAGTALACGPGCPDLIAKGKSNVDSQKQHETMLAKNEKILASLAPDQASMAIKIRSNIVILRLRLETIQNNAEIIRQAFDVQTCAQCPL